jgi:PAS domain-containing protein
MIRSLTRLQARANEAAEHLSGGIPATEWPVRRLGEVLPHLDTGLIEQSLRQVLATGRPVGDVEVSSHAGSDLTGEQFWSCARLRANGPGDKIARVARTMREITARPQPAP